MYRMVFGFKTSAAAATALVVAKSRLNGSEVVLSIKLDTTAFTISIIVKAGSEGVPWFTLADVLSAVEVGKGALLSANPITPEEAGKAR